MKGILLEGVQPDKRFRASLILGAVFIVLLIAQGFDLIPGMLNRLPAHSEASSIDNVGYGEHYEAVTMTGCNNRQRLFQLELPVAMPHILLGINQTTMFAFSMVVIAAFIGTIDLGQAIFKALSESDLGKGLTLGLSISFMALTVDHLITRWAKERRALLGLD